MIKLTDLEHQNKLLKAQENGKRPADASGIDH